MRTRISQDNRAGRITCSLGADALALLRFDGTEYVNGVFTYHVDAQAESETVNLNDLIGTHLTVTLSSDGNGDQHFDGIVTQARWTGNTEGHANVRMVIEPWFALLRLRRNQRIFHEVTVVEILEELFSPYSGMGQPSFRRSLNGSYEPLEYTVQYRESDANFALRLMERFGISYYYEHVEGSHTLVLTDAMTQFPEIEGTGRDFLSNRDARGEHFWDWQCENNMTTGAVRLTDFNFKTPAAMMEVDRAGSAPYEQGDIESFDYPGDYLEADGQGRAVATLRVDQERGRDDRHRAAGDIVSLRAGMKVELTGQSHPELVDKSYLCLQANHSFVSGQLDSTGGADGDGTYSGHYVLTSVDMPFGPARVTPRAMIYGPQTAMVVGPSGEEIHCDEYGRIKVKFHWDLDADHSMWCRVSQNWAGAGWGGMVIPRIGMEVVVEFLEGDPDKPLVTGCVYNNRSMPPYELPTNKTRSTFKTNSSQGEGFNEIRFEDDAGNEEIYVHGQKDMNTVVGNNRTERVNNNAVDSVGNNHGTEIGNNLAQVVGGSMRLNVGQSAINSISPADASDAIQGISGTATDLNDGDNEGDLFIVTDRDKNQTIGNCHIETVAMDSEKNIGNDLIQNITNNWDNDVGGAVNIIADDDITLETMGDITLHGGGKITLVVGGSTIELTAGGQISVDGNMMEMNLGSMIKLAAGMIKLN